LIVKFSPYQKNMNPIFLILIFLIFGVFLLFFFNAKNKYTSRIAGILISGLVLIVSADIVSSFDGNIIYFQYISQMYLGSSVLNLNYVFGLDGLSLFFFSLSSLLVFSCLLFVWENSLFKFYCIALLLIEAFLLIIFSVLDLFVFYIFFEAILIPMFLIIGVWGSRERSVRAGYLFFFYTFCGSIMMLLGILYIYSITGTLNLEIINFYFFSEKEQLFLWMSFFLSFASKIPMYPLHIWLPEAHVEAPTVGSVLLAGILLKLGVYGFLRFSLLLFFDASVYFSPLIYLLGTIGIIYASMTAIRQTDLKRILAYSSIAHMNLVTLGIFSFTILGFEGAVLQSLSHGFVSGGLFFLVGVVYERYHSRSLFYYTGLAHTMPVYALILFVFTLANIALPGTSSFVGEFLLLIGVFKKNVIVCIISALSVILGGAYSLWLYNRIIFGNLSAYALLGYRDVDFREISVLSPLFLLIFIMGVYPHIFIDLIRFSVSFFRH